jgi:gluconolactonase
MLAADNYAPGPDSKPQPGVPKGQILKFTLEDSKIFPGTKHDYWVYVPAEYTPDKPACVYVGQDGMGFDAPTVFDNLIYKKQIPIIIGVFVKPGIVYAMDTNSALNRYNRSYEYDSLGDNYARFLLEEILPQVEKIVLPDGRAVHLSHDGNDRCIAGESSGGICAFTVAWERPNDFRRVFSAIGTFVDLRDGEIYPSLIRKYEPKPIRVFLQDGSADHNKYGGDWWMANQTLERALVFAGYDVNHVWGTGGHSGAHGTAIFPDVMRWLWRDWPAPIQAGWSQNDTLTNILIPGEGWQVVADGLSGSDGPAVNARGEVFFSETHSNRIWKITTDGQRELFATNAIGVDGEAFGPDGRLYTVSMNSKELVAYDADGNATVMATNLNGNDIAIAHNGDMYMTDPMTYATSKDNKVWLVKPNGSRQLVDSGTLRYGNGVTLSPDQSLLYVDDWRSHWVYSYVIELDGTLAERQRYDDLQMTDVYDQSNADGMRVDRDGRLYVATNLGVQVCDQAGRVQCILPTPNGKISNLSFGGANFDTLFATCGDKVFKRRLNVTGANGWDAPNRPAPPRL